MGTMHLNLCIRNAYTSVILAIYYCDYKIGNLWNLGCMKFSCRNGTENSEALGFINPRYPPDMNSKNSSKRTGP